jgi:hypothetical protein
MNALAKACDLIFINLCWFRSYLLFLVVSFHSVLLFLRTLSTSWLCDQSKSISVYCVYYAYREFTDGIIVEDINGNRLGCSREVTKHAITQVIISRTGMAIPHMVFTPIIINALHKKEWFRSRLYVTALIQTAMCGFLLTFATPICCAFFPQRGSIEVNKLEAEVRNKIENMSNPPNVVYYNKGL